MAASEDYLGVEVRGAGRDAEICELYHAVLVHQQVRALNIAVDHSFIMYIFETHQNLTEITIKNFNKKRRGESPDQSAFTDGSGVEIRPLGTDVVAFEVARSASTEFEV